MVENLDLICSDSHPLFQEELLKIFFRNGPEFDIQVDRLQALFIRAIAIIDLVKTILGSKGMWRFSYTATVCVQSIQI
ncbi:hypothetical protein CY35_17G033400 [Sphagnum magellanicum]|nr:hypothetical protein CY35_17G033400 [Sphagnum magellanicum]